MQVYNIYQRFLEDGGKISKIMEHLKEPYSNWISQQKKIIKAHVNYSYQHNLFCKGISAYEHNWFSNVFYYWYQKFT